MFYYPNETCTYKQFLLSQHRVPIPIARVQLNRRLINPKADRPWDPRRSSDHWVCRHPGNRLRLNMLILKMWGRSVSEGFPSVPLSLNARVTYHDSLKLRQRYDRYIGEYQGYNLPVQGVEDGVWCVPKLRSCINIYLNTSRDSRSPHILWLRRRNI